MALCEALWRASTPHESSSEPGPAPQYNVRRACPSLLPRVWADGQRFLVNDFIEEMISPAIQLVNWPAGLAK